MKNPITTLHIQNFKTIKDLKVDCKRINIIIGKPNVGKSNFLEALSLLGGTYSYSESKLLSEFIRYNKFEDLFYDKETQNSISVDSNIGVACIKTTDSTAQLFQFYLGPDEDTVWNDIKLYDDNDESKDNEDDLDLINHKYSGHLKGQQTILPLYFRMSEPDGNPMEYVDVSWFSPVKKYDFRKDIDSTNRFHDFLLPPYGNNIFTILNRNKKLLKEIGYFFKEYKLKFGLRMSDTSFEVLKQVGHYVYSTSYNLIADTLQRMIFNIAAIESNKESILLFEEPEAHSSPPYVKLFAEKVIASKTNQFFIATHSPFVLNTIIENTPLEEVAIFVASYEKYQTKLTELNEIQIREMLDYGNDIFFSPQVLA